jgi:hypothetical protein
MRRAVDDALSASVLPVVVSKNGRTRTKDIRPLIRELRTGEGTATSIEAVLTLQPGATCRPSELLAALFPGQDFFNFIVARSSCLIQKNGRLAGIQEEG